MEDLFVNEEVTIPGSELRLSFARSGGPGGQYVNKVETKVELHWAPAGSLVLSSSDREWLLERLAGRLTSGGDLLVTSSRTRDQARNREDARDKLARLVREALRRPKRRRPSRPSGAAVEKRIQEKKQRARIKRERRPPQPDV